MSLVSDHFPGFLRKYCLEIFALRGLLVGACTAVCTNLGTEPLDHATFLAFLRPVQRLQNCAHVQQLPAMLSHFHQHSTISATFSNLKANFRKFQPFSGPSKYLEQFLSISSHVQSFIRQSVKKLKWKTLCQQLGFRGHSDVLQ